MEVFRKCKALATSVHEDRISGLPDEVVLTILSRLPMKEAVRSSILSRSWKNLWKAYSGCLDFDAPNLIRLIEYHELVRHYASCRYTVWVDKVLDSHQSQTIEGLRIVFDLNTYFSRSIDRWIDFAISRKVRSLVLDLSPSSHLFRCLKECFYNFPAWLLYVPLGLRAFDKLTSLELRFVNVPEEVIQYLFGNCHMLQWLSLEEIPYLKNFRLDNSLPELKHLEISTCHALVNVYVSARRLRSFKYVSTLIDRTYMDFGDVPELDKLDLGGVHYKVVLDNLPFPFSQLESVALNIYAPVCFNNLLSPNTLLSFQELKHLELNIEGYLGSDVLCSGSFLHVSTRLEKLVLKLTWNYPRRYRPRKMKHECSTYRHGRLKELVYVGWLGLDPEVEIVALMIESTSPSILERITINLCHSHNDKYAITLKTSWEKEIAKSRAMQLQQKLVSSSSRAKLLIH